MSTIVCGCTSTTQVEGTSTYIIQLSSGRTLSEMIDGVFSIIPGALELYVGNDIEVPADVRATDRDLAIHFKNSFEISSLTVCYDDSVNGNWVGPTTANVVYMNDERTWAVWEDFLDIVIPYKSRITLIAITDNVPVEKNPTTLVQFQQPEYDGTLKLLLQIFNDSQFTELNTVIDTAEDHQDYDITVATDGGYIEFPAEGADSSTAEELVTVDLRNLDYENIVYVKWSWVDVTSEYIVSSGITTYPAFLAVKPEKAADPEQPRVLDSFVTKESPAGSGEIVLDNEHNAYLVRPTGSVQISIDTSELGEVLGASFYMLLDLSTEVVPITFPDSWVWVSGEAPTMNKRAYYVFRVTTSSLGVSKYFSEYLGLTKDPADFTKGIWFWDDNGELDDSVYDGQTYSASAVFSGGTMLVNNGTVVGTLRGDDSFDPDEYTIKPASCLIAGTVGLLIMGANGGSAATYVAATIDGGTISGNVNIECDDGDNGPWFHVNDGMIGDVTANGSSFIEISGGTTRGITYYGPTPSATFDVSSGIVSSVTALSADGLIVRVSGGSIQSFVINYSDALFRLSGGVIDRLNCDFATGSVTIDGGTLRTSLRLIDSSLHIISGEVLAQTSLLLNSTLTLSGGFVTGDISIEEEDTTLVVEGGYVKTISDVGFVSNITINGGTVSNVLASNYSTNVLVGGTALLGFVELGDNDQSWEAGAFLSISGDPCILRVEDTYSTDEEDSVVKAGIRITGGTVCIAPALKEKIDAGKVSLNIVGGTVIYLPE